MGRYINGNLKNCHTLFQFFTANSHGFGLGASSYLFLIAFDSYTMIPEANVIKKKTEVRINIYYTDRKSRSEPPKYDENNELKAVRERYRETLVAVDLLS